MEIRKLAGGQVIGANPDRLKFPLYGKDPMFRTGSPGTILGNVGSYVQLSECAKLQSGIPEPTLVKVVFRVIDQETYLLVSPANQTGPDIYPLKFEIGSKAPTIRGLKPLFEEAKITLRPDLWYEGETEVVHDQDLGYAVALNWTQVSTRPRKTAGDGAEAESAEEEFEPEVEAESAAGEQEA